MTSFGALRDDEGKKNIVPITFENPKGVLESGDEDDPEPAANVRLQINHPEFESYLNRTGALDMLNGTLTALYHTHPRPTFPRHFFRNLVGTYCDAPPDPLMELIEAKHRIEQLQKENEGLRDKWIAAIQVRANINSAKSKLAEENKRKLAEAKLAVEKMAKEKLAKKKLGKGKAAKEKSEKSGGKH